MMFTVYVLFSKSYDKIYIGYTSDIEKRLISHNKLGTKGWTLKYRPWELIYKEVYSTRSAALKREKELKSSRGRNWIRTELLPEI